MYFHLFVAFSCWIIGISVPSLSDKYLLAFTIIGFLAFFLFLKESLNELNRKFLKEAAEAETENERNLASFKGKFIAIRDEDSPFSNDFSYLIFNNGEIEVPLFCRNMRVIQKAAQAKGQDLMIYYKDYILVDVEEVEQEHQQSS